MLCHRQLFVYHCLGLNKSILREFEMNKTTDQITKELSRPGYLNLCGLYRKLNTSIVHRHLKLERRGLLIDKCLRLIPKYMQSMIFYIIFTSKLLCHVTVSRGTVSRDLLFVDYFVGPKISRDVDFVYVGHF